MRISTSHTDTYGRQIVGVGGPFEIRQAVRDGSGNDGGALDRAIVGRTSDGKKVIIGELWAMGPATGNERVSLDSFAHAEAIINLLNGPSAAGVDEIVARVAKGFPGFGGGKSSHSNPLASAFADDPPMFALGVGVRSVVEFVLAALREQAYAHEEVGS